MSNLTINDLFPSRFLKASDLKNQPRTVTIAKVTREEVGNGKDKKSKPVVCFAGIKKGLVLNVTNAKRIAEVTGSLAINGWVGKEITLVPAEVEFGGELMAAIRVAKSNGRDATTELSDGNESAFENDGNEDVADEDIPF